MTDLAAGYDPQSFESQIYAEWEASGCFTPSGQGTPYTILLPPPNVTGTLHMGHAFQHTLQDALIRYHRMRGFDALWQMGSDHAGIATEMVVSRNLQLAGSNETRDSLGRDRFIEKVWEWKAQSGDNIERQMRRVGVSGDWSRRVFTMDAAPSTAVLEAFVRLYEEGLIYRGKHLVNWDPVLQTAISDLEVENIEEDGFLWSIAYPLTDSDEKLVVATTRPETMLGDTALMVHPDDERYQHLIGKTVRLPLVERDIPIIADAYVDREFGTGVVKVTPAHDFNDYQVGMRHQLPIINIFTPTATINDAAPERYRGLDRYKARDLILTDLKAQGLLVETKRHKLQVPRGDRTGQVIEPYLTDQWFIRMDQLGQRGMELFENGSIGFVPPNWINTYRHWMENIQDWCISRQLWWGHQIPAWYDQDGNIYVARSEEEALQQAREKVGYSPEKPKAALGGGMQLGGDDGVSLDAARIEKPQSGLQLGGDSAGVQLGGGEDPAQTAATLTSRNTVPDPVLRRDDDVLETWFSSALWPFSTMGWPDPEAMAARNYDRYLPTSVLVTGFDIIFFWVARMVMMTDHFTGKIPFREVYITGLVRDKDGQKMSKSKGNILDPLDIIDGIDLDALVAKRTTGLLRPQDASKIERLTRRDFPQGIATYGADPLRFTMAALAGPGRDIKFDLGRCEGYKNFCNKLWNATRFVLMNCGDIKFGVVPEPQTDAEKWILAQLTAVTNEVHEHFAAYRFDLLTQTLYEFTWNTFCDWFLELTKPALAGADTAVADSTRRTLLYVLEALLRLLHPLIPFITEALWQKLLPNMDEQRVAQWVIRDTTQTQHPSISLQPYPEPATVPEAYAHAEADIEWLKSMVTAVRRIRSELGISPGTALRLQLQAGRAKDRSRTKQFDSQLQFLLRLESIEWLLSAAEPPPSAAAVIGDMKVFVPLEGVVDLDAERTRLDKEIKQVEVEIARCNTKLDNPTFVRNAPQAVVEQERNRLAEWSTKLEGLREQRTRLK